MHWLRLPVSWGIEVVIIIISFLFPTSVRKLAVVPYSFRWKYVPPHPTLLNIFTLSKYWILLFFCIYWNDTIFLKFVNTVNYKVFKCIDQQPWMYSFNIATYSRGYSQKAVTTMLKCFLWINMSRLNFYNLLLLTLKRLNTDLHCQSWQVHGIK